MTIVRKLIATIGFAALGVVPALAGGDASYAPKQNDSPFYVGAVVGYGWGKVSDGEDSVNTRGAMGGGLVGYRISSGDMSVALEGDLLGAKIDYTKSETEVFRGGTETSAVQFGTDLLASLRIKGSWGQGPIRPYLTGGMAWQRIGYKISDVERTGNQVLIESSSVSANQLGFTVGTGIDWKTSGSFSATLGYQYYRFKDDVSLDDEDYDLTTNLHTIRLGGKLHF